MAKHKFNMFLRVQKIFEENVCFYLRFSEYVSLLRQVYGIKGY